MYLHVRTCQSSDIPKCKCEKGVKPTVIFTLNPTSYMKQSKHYLKKSRSLKIRSFLYFVRLQGVLRAVLGTYDNTFLNISCCMKLI